MLRENFFRAMVALAHPSIFIFSAGTLWMDVALNAGQCNVLANNGIPFQKELLTTA
jgi:hypothetical protein